MAYTYSSVLWLRRIRAAWALTKSLYTQPRPKKLFPAGTLCVLSPEILLQIAEACELSAAACFTLTSKYLYTVLSTKYIHALNLLDNRTEKEKFLALLSTQFPRYIYCVACETLHHVDAMQWPRLHIRTQLSIKPACLRVCPGLNVNVPYFNLGFLHIASSMRRYQHDLPCGLVLDAFNFAYVTECFIQGCDYPTERAVDSKILDLDRVKHRGSRAVKTCARIVNNNFLLHTVYRAFATPGSTMDIMREILLHLRVCPHLWGAGFSQGQYLALEVVAQRVSAYRERYDDAKWRDRESWKPKNTKKFPWLLHCAVEHVEGKSTDMAFRGLKACKYCTTEVLIECYHDFGWGECVQVSVWQNLGSGKDYLDPTLQAHLGEGAEWQHEDPLVSDAKGEIREPFENSENN